MITRMQRLAGRSACRPGTVVPFLAFTIVALLAFLALSIDLGMLAIAKAQAQNAADLAALTAARTLNGSSSTASPNNGAYNNTAATTNAQNVMTYNVILGQQMQSSQLTTLSFGSYDYNQSTQLFSSNYPPTSGKPYTAVTATVTASNMPGAFSTIFGMQFLPTVTATAQAVHRPRDVALVMDLSGSMRFGTCLGFDFYTTSRGTNNPDTAYPKFGHYSSSSAAMQGTTSNRTSGSDSYTISPSNSTYPTSSYTLTYVNNFYQNAAYASPLIRAFDSYSSTDGGITWTAPTTQRPQLPASSYTTTPGGDLPLYKGNTSTYAQHAQDVTGSSTRNMWWELDGYSGDTNGTFNNADLGTSSYSSGSFYGYTQGPGYYGKTFFTWPPDPRRPLNTGTATSYSTVANDQATINQFLQDFGYTTSADLNNSAFTTTWTPSANVSSLTNPLSITVNSATPFPTSALPTTTFQIQISSGSTIKEIMTVTAALGTVFTVTRGQAGTTAASYTRNTTYTVGLVTAPALLGLYTAASTSVSPAGKTPTTSQTWPWPNDTGTTLSTYLTTQVYIPSNPPSPDSAPTTARLLQTTDRAYQKIMRLYNWNYVVDNYNSAGSGSNYPGTTPADWRIRFFGTNDNTKLFQTSGSNKGSLNLPGSLTYTINYNEILRWLTSSQDPFPTQMRAGRIKYYGSIPTAITGSWPSYGSTDQRFWKESIDYMLGFWQTSSTGYQDISAMAGLGGDFNWGTPSLSSAPSSTQYMNYTDIPNRPRLRLWFGPMNMTDFLQNYNTYTNVGPAYFMQPGDSYEAPLYNGKQSFLAAVTTMQNNHPNDWFTVVPYSWPRSSASTVFGRFNCVMCPLGTNYNYASSALLFPFSTINADGTCNNTEITPYDADTKTSLVPSANFMDTPRADGDTCFAMALMHCYNQFAITPSSDTTLRTFVTNTPITFPTAMAGGMGRKGAQKVIIFETDGMANCSATASLVWDPTHTYQYFQIRYDMNKPYSSEYPSINPVDINDSGVLGQLYGSSSSLITTLYNTYNTSRNPFKLYPIGFGPVFAGSDATSATTTLTNMQNYATNPTNPPTTSLPTNQIITGSGSTMQTNMTAAFTSILQNGVQIALIQ